MRTQTNTAVAPHTDIRFVPSETLTDVTDMQRVIAALYFESPNTLDIRPLWVDGTLTYFRVNWWRRGHVARSAFLAVEVRREGWRVYDYTRQAA
ncbi:MAG: hypothetical protein AB1716_17450 [Planctomycetota bacterium]